MRIHYYAKATLASFALILPPAFLFQNCGGKGIDAGTFIPSTSISNPCPTVASAIPKPASIEDVVTIINSLPKPLTLNCFLWSLPRPMNISAAVSTFSAQTSDGVDNPRIFIINQDFLLSVIPTGTGKNLLEMSKFISSTKSVKAEVEFPVAANISAANPYDQIAEMSGGTSCKICHNSEALASGSYGGTAYSSDILRPDPARRVVLADLVQKSNSCDTAADSYRCAILHSIFGYNQIKEVLFP